MKNIYIGIADDDAKVHQGLIDLFDGHKDYKVQMEHFYSTDDLKTYLYEDPYPFDMLFLDVEFEGAESGIDALPKIREYAPILPITLLTAHDELDLILPAENFDVGYLKKPISASEFIITMKFILRQKKDYEKLLADMNDYVEYANVVENEKQDLETRLAQVCEEKIPTEFKNLILSVFPDIEFSSKALFELLGRKLDERVFKVLKTVDWKLSPSPGMHVQAFHESERDNVWEYRLSQKGRVLVEYRKEKKPEVFLIDYDHKNW